MFLINYPPPHRKYLWILGHETTLMSSNSVWSKVVEDAKKRFCYFSADVDQYLATAIKLIKATETNLHMGQDLKAMETNSDTGQGQLIVDNLVGAVIEEANIDFSPSHVPSRKRLCKSEDARSEVPEARPEVPEDSRSEVPEAGPEVPEVAQAVEDDDVIIQVLPPLNAAKAYTSMKKRVKRAKRENFYEHARSATDDRFWSIEQQERYDNVYKTKGFGDNRWIDWENVKHFKEMLDVETKCKNIGLHKLVGIRKEWHEETVRQFFSTCYINPSRTSLTWMSGINMKITVTKRFCQKVLLVDPLHSSKIEDKLTSTQDDEFNTWKKNAEIFSVANRLLRKTIYPRSGDSGNVHNDNKVILYHLLTEKPFDIVDMMFREMEKAQSDKRILIPYAPYIMLLIDRATKGKIVPKTEEFRAHPVYNIMQIETINMQMETEQHQNKRAVSKDKASLSVPPLINPKSKTLVFLNPNW